MGIEQRRKTLNPGKTLNKLSLIGLSLHVRQKFIPTREKIIYICLKIGYMNIYAKQQHTAFQKFLEYEKATKTRSRYTEPKTKEIMIMLEVAYEEKPVKTKIAAIQMPSEF